MSSSGNRTIRLLAPVILIVVLLLVFLYWKSGASAGGGRDANPRTKLPRQAADGSRRNPAGSHRDVDSGKATLSFKRFMEKLSSETDPERRRKLLGQMVAEYGGYLADEVFEYLSHDEPADDARVPLMQLACLNPAEHPDIFYKVFDSYAPGRDRDSLIEAGLGAFTPEQAVALLKHLAEQGYMEDLSRVAYKIDASGCFKSDRYTPEVLRDFMVRFPEGPIHTALVQALAWRMEKDGAGSPQSGDLLASAGATPEMPQADPRPAASVPFVIPGEATRDNPDHRQVQDEAGINMGKVGPLRALDAADEFQGESRDIYLRKIAERWLDADSRAASREIAKLPAGPDRDVLIQTLLGYSIRNQDMASAGKWLPLIQSEETRLRVSAGLERMK